MHSIYDPAASGAKYVELLELAAGRHADLVVFPELSLQGYLYQLTPDWTLPAEELEYQYSHAEPVPGPTTRLYHQRGGDIGSGAVVRSTGTQSAAHGELGSGAGPWR